MVNENATKQASKKKNWLLGGCLVLAFLFLEGLLVLLFLTVNYGYRHGKSILDSGIAIQATVAKATDAHKGVSRQKHVQLRYTIGDRTYFHTDYFNDQLNIGDSAEVIYDPTNPFHASFPGEITEESVQRIWIISMLFLFAAIILPIITGIGVVKIRKTNNL